MVDTCFTAQTATKQSMVTMIGRLTFWRNDSGQYTHATITQLKKGIQHALKQQYNPAGGANGMLDLLNTNIIGPQANKTATAADILCKSKQEADNEAEQKRHHCNVQNHIVIRCARRSQQMQHHQPSAD